jgi:hypothetical protein
VLGINCIDQDYVSGIVRDVIIRGNKFTNSSIGGIGFDPSERIVIANNIITGVGEHGIYGSNLRDATITGNVITSTGRNGIQLRNGSVGGGRLTIAGNTIRACAENGIITADTEVEDFVVTGNVIRDCVGDGMLFAYAQAGKLTVTGNSVAGCSNNIQMTDVDYATITGNSFRVAAGSGVRLNSCEGCVVGSNAFHDNNTDNNALSAIFINGGGSHLIVGNKIKTQYANSNGIKNANTATENQILDNDVSGCAISQANRIKDFGATDTIRGNKGWVTENNGSGTIASGSTAVTITHGLNRTPAAKNVSVTPTANTTTDPGNIWVDTITSTQFNVNCRTNPGAGGMAFDWQAVVL